MTGWDHWPPQRFIYLFIGLAYFLIWVQVSLFHWRGAFRHWPMWGPVLDSPLLGIIGILFAIIHGGWLNTLFLILFGLGTLGGLAGIYYHLAGIKHYIGGYTLRNFMVGPPIMLPITFMALSVAAIITYFLDPLR